MLDHSLGQTGQPVISTNINGGNDYAVDARLGKIVSDNLFLSFWQFILATNESATFTGPPSVQNIIARVTGGGVSTIDGTINVEISGANFFLMNPAGVVFTSNASLNVPGSFTVTTADYLKFTDGTRFTAYRSRSDASLSASSVSAFGFLAGSSPPAAVTFSGSYLSTAQGMNFIVVGGNQTIDGALLAAPAAQLTLVSVAGAGEVPAVPAVLAATPLTALPALGTINIQNSAYVTAGSFDTGGSGHVEIDADAVTVSNLSTIDASMNSVPSGAPTEASSILVRCQSLLVSGVSAIQAQASGFGIAGAINLQAQNIVVTGTSQIETITSNQSVGGSITVAANSLNIDGSSIQTSANGSGAAGDINVTANSISITGVSSFLASGILAESGYAGLDGEIFTGRGGDIHVATQQLTLMSGGQISATTFGPGQGGNVSVTAITIAISGSSSFNEQPGIIVFQSGILASSELPGNEGAGGQGGSVTVSTGSLQVSNGGLISASTIGSGAGGNVTVNASSIVLDGTGAALPTGFAATTSYQTGGIGGNITIAAGSLQVLGGAEISAATAGGAAGGNISVSGGSVVVSGAGSIITAQTTAAEGGPGGNLQFNVTSLSVLDGGQISASTQGSGKGGSIEITAQQVTVDGSSSSISAGTSGMNEIVSTNPFVQELSVTLNVTYPSDSDLDATLVSPISNTIPLFNGGDATGSGFANTTLSDSGAYPITGGIAPYSGTYQPATPLGLLTGGVANGVWEVLMSGYPQGSGSVNAVSLTVNGTQFTSSAVPQQITAGIYANLVVPITVSLPAIQTLVQAGAGGNIQITGGTVNLSNGGTVSASTLGDGAAGSISIQANSININAAGAASNTGIFASTAPGSTGRGGSISISANQFQVSGNSNPAIVGGVVASSATNASAGDITVQSANLALNSNAVISSANDGGGPAGSVNLTASDSITLQGRSLVTVVAQSSNAGTISLAAVQNVEVLGGSTISASAGGGGGNITIGAGGLFDLDQSSVVATAGAGAGGNITIGTTSVTLENGLISANAAGISLGSNAGNISLAASQNVELLNGSTITASAATSGGSITIHAGGLFDQDHSSIVATAGKGSGGDITIDPDFIILDHSLISANAQAGAGGNILIAGSYFFDNGSLVTATGTTSGTVQITTLPLDLVNALSDLQGGFIDLSTTLQDRCAMRLGTDYSSFLVIGRGGVEDSPDNPQEEVTVRLRKKGKGKGHDR